MQRQTRLVQGNFYNKNKTRNPVFRKIVLNYHHHLDELLQPLKPKSILEIGCGDGSLIHKIRSRYDPEPFASGLDIGFEILTKALHSHPTVPFIQASADRLPFPDASFDLVLAPEVLEHVENPGLSLSEISRIGSEHYIVSVPWEPFWRIGNVLSGRYLTRLGNTPGHVQHWTKSAFIKLLSSYMNIIKVALPFPWILALGKRKH